MPTKLTIAFAAALVAGLFAIPALAQEASCVIAEPDDPDTEEVAPGVTLIFDGSFLCADAPDEGEYQITGTIANDSGSTNSADLSAVVFSFSTPPGSSGSVDDFGFGDGTLDPGESTSFTASGDYSLVETDEGMKANLHLRINGNAAGEDFALGVNVHLRAPGATEDGGDDGDNGDPPFDVPPEGNPLDSDTETDVLGTSATIQQVSDDAGLEQAIVELSEEIPGDANQVRANVAAMLGVIASGADGLDDTVGQPEDPGAFGKGVAALANEISDEDEDEEEEEEEEEENGDSEGQGSPPPGTPAGGP